MDNSNKSEIASITGSQRSTTSKHGKYVPKHCPLCDNNIFKKWPNHVAGKHNGDKTIKGIDCRGDSCPICFDQEIKSQHSQSNRKDNRHTKLLCFECQQLKRSDTLDKVSGKCIACMKKGQPQPFKVPNIAKAVTKSARSRAQDNLTGKRVDGHPSSTNIQKSIQDKIKTNLYVQDDTISEEQEEEKLTTESLKRMRLCEENLDQNIAPFDILSLSMPSVGQTQFKYIDQGMRDTEAFLTVKEIEDGIIPLQDQEQKLLKIIPLLTQKTITTYLESAPRSQFSLALLSLLNSDIVFDEKLMLHIIYTAIITGPQTWSALPAFFQKMNPDTRASVFETVRHIVAGRFDSIIAEWIFSNWQHLKDQTLELIHYLDKKPSMYGYQILCFSIIVNSSDDISSFVEACETFALSPSLFNLVLEGLKRCTTQSKMSLRQFQQLLSELRKYQNAHIIKENREELVLSPVVNWFGFIEQQQSKVLIEDVNSIQLQLEALQDHYSQYGSLPTQFKKDLTISSPFVGFVIKKLSKRPNNLQLALAQYAMAQIQKLPLQLLVFGAGQGKSFIEKLIAFLLINTQSSERIHLVYSNQHLLNRDKRNFQELMALAQLNEDQIQFQVGLNFQRDPSDIIIIDESDALIFTEPTTFKSLVRGNKCICLTATPDDNDKQGMEKAIIDALGFKTIAPIIAQQTVNPSIDRYLPLQSKASLKQDLHEFIKAKLQQRAILLYCDQEMKDYLEQQQQAFTFVDQQDFSDEIIANMDTIQEDKSFMLVVTTNAKIGMRGLDYRAPVNGITLIVAASFENQREMVQGLYRVGRYQDPCERIGLECVPLISQELELAYYARLAQFIAAHSKKIVAKVSVPVKEKFLIPKKQKQTIQNSSKRQTLIDLINRQQEKKKKEEEEINQKAQ